MIGPGRADLKKVSGSDSTLDALDAVLGALPEPVVIGHDGYRRLVASPGGIFVLDTSDGEVSAVADRAAVAARITREQLAEHLSWVPFVDWFVIAPAGTPAAHSVLPVDLVETTVLEGHVVDDDVLAQVTKLVMGESLGPQWAPGLSLPDDDAATVAEEPLDASTQ